MCGDHPGKVIQSSVVSVNLMEVNDPVVIDAEHYHLITRKLKKTGGAFGTGRGHGTNGSYHQLFLESGCQLAAKTQRIGAKRGEETVFFPAEPHDFSTS